MAITSVTPGQGKTTLAVNLAFGLIRRGYSAVIVDMGGDRGLQDWLEKMPEVPEDLRLASWEEYKEQADEQGYIGVVDLDAERPGAGEVLAQADMVAGVVSLVGEFPSVEEMESAEQRVRQIRGRQTGFDLVVPNRLNPREWKENEGKLMTLVEVWGEERVADPLPG